LEIVAKFYQGYKKRNEHMRTRPKVLCLEGSRDAYVRLQTLGHVEDARTAFTVKPQYSNFLDAGDSTYCEGKRSRRLPYQEIFFEKRPT
jgi:hypothetical protein